MATKKKSAQRANSAGSGGKSSSNSAAPPPEVLSPHDVFDDSLLPKWIDEALLELDPANANIHDDFNVDSIAKSLKRFGQRTPIVVQAGTSIVKKGNGTLIALRKCCDQIKTDPAAATRENWNRNFAAQCIARKIAAVAAPLDDMNATGYAIADNQIGRTSQFDFRRLGGQLRSLRDEGFELSALGFADAEIKPLIDAADYTPPPPVDPNYTPPEGSTPPDSAGERNKLVSFTPAQWRDVESSIAVLIHRGHVGDDMNDAASVVVLAAQFMESSVSEQEREQVRRMTISTDTRDELRK